MRCGDKRVWWQQAAGVVTRSWSAFDPPQGRQIYESEVEAIAAARNWLSTQIHRLQLEIMRLQSRARAMDQREAAKEEEEEPNDVDG